jgi:hypothetical protein
LIGRERVEGGGRGKEEREEERDVKEECDAPFAMVGFLG